MKQYVFCAALFMTCIPVYSQVTFGNPATTPVKAIPRSIVAADFNHDGKLDVAVSAIVYKNVFLASGILLIFLGKGDGTFGEPVQYDAACAAPPLIAGRVYKNGDLDLVSVCTSFVAVFRGMGDGTFTGPVYTPIKEPADALSAAAADFNGDGILDLAIPGGGGFGGATIPNSGPGGVSILFGKGDGTFQPPRQIGSNAAERILVADCNLDGFADIITTASLGRPVGVYLGKGDGTFGPNLVLSGSETSDLWATADVNGDGLPDLIGPGGFGPVQVFLGQGDGTFQAQTPITGPCFASHVARLVDLSGTGIGHLVLLPSAAAGGCSTDGFSLLAGKGDGTFSDANFIATGLDNPADVASGDFNGDGLTDLVFVASHGTREDDPTSVTAQLYVFLNTTSVPFLSKNSASYATGPVAPESIVAAFAFSVPAIAAGTGQPDSVSLPFTLAGASVMIKDSLGVTRPAPLFYVGPRQINYEIPSGTATGPAVVTVASPVGVFSQLQQIVPIAPGIYYAAGGLAAANVVTFHNGKVSSIGITAEADKTGTFSLVPIDLGTDQDQVFLELYGTGLRRHRGPAIVTIGDTPVRASYAGPQGTYEGEDQVNVEIPKSLRGAGVVSVFLTVDGQSTNAVNISIR